MSEMVEIVARAIYDSDRGYGDRPWSKAIKLDKMLCRNAARAAIEAMLSKEHAELFASATGIPALSSRAASSPPSLAGTIAERT